MRDFKAYSFPKNQFGEPEGNFEKVHSNSPIKFRKSVVSKLKLEEGPISSTFYVQLFSHKDPKSAKKTDKLTVCIYPLSESEHKKLSVEC